MKTIFDKRQVAHMWAQGPDAIKEHGSEIRTATGNLFTRPVWVSATDKRAAREESALWSYGSHYCLARFARVRLQPRGHGYAVLLNANGYSKTTERQKSLVRAALHGHGYAIFHVDKPEAGNTSAHVANLADYRARYEAAVIAAGAPRIREATRAANLARAESLLEEANAYAAAFGLSRHKLRPVNTDQIAARVKREEAAAARQREEAERRRAAEHAAALADAAEAIAEWRAGSRSTDSLPSVARYNRGAMLRLRAGGSIVETSAGASFPTEAARMLWDMIRAARNGNPYSYRKTDPRGVWPSDAPRISIGAFTLDSIDANGNVRAGCHTVEFAECAALAALLGLPESDTYSYAAAGAQGF